MMTVRWLREQMRMGKSIYDLPLRVTFYARVSTEKVEQQGSLENQIQYYTEFIQKNPNWTYIPGYIDEGISGTSTYKRDSFLRMIADAQRGMFDFIITKEISRFSRNTLDSIQYTQELLENNVGVLFQNDNINTLDSDSEFRLVVMAGVAQDEVRKLSERLKFGFRQSIKNGRVLGNNRLWGYDKKDCKLTIVPEQAEVVKQIFDLYATGQYGLRSLSQELTRRGYTSLQGNAFNTSTIGHILQNPKYKGWYCGNKTTARKRRRSSMKTNGCPIPTQIFRPSYRKKYGIRPTPFLSKGAPVRKPMVWGIKAGIRTAAKLSAESTEHLFTGNPSKHRRAKRSSGNARCTVNTGKQAVTCLPFAPRNWILFWQSSFRSW